jgi:hypothetical protein
MYYVTGRGQAALNRDESIEQGLVAEQSFFDNTEPWRGLPDKSLLGTKNLRVKLAELQMNIIRSSFKDIKLEMKVKRDKAALAYQELGNLPSNLSEKRFLFQRIKEEISNGISSITLGGRICSTQNDRKMRPSAKFQLNANSYQTSLNSSKLANISEVVVGSKVIVLDGECEVRGEVVFINDNDDVFIKHVVANNIKKPGELCTMTDGSVYTSANSIPVDGPATTPYAFGSTNNDSPAFSFGASDPLSVTPSPFTAPINPFAVDGAFTAVGTTLAPYRTTTRQTADSTTPIVFQTITAMPQYEEKSLEELRLEDYMVKSKSKRASSEKRRIRRSAKPLFEAASASGGGSGISIERSSSYAGFPPMISAAPTNTFATKASSGGGWFGSAPDSAPLENRLTVGIQSFKRTLVRPDPEWISDFIKWNRPYKLPIFIDPDVFNAIVVNLIEKEWVKPGTDLLESTSELMGIIAEEFILEAKLIASFHLFKSFLTAKASKVVEDLTIEARQRIEEFVTREKVPYTQNHYIFENLCKLRTQRLMDEVLSALPAGEEDVEVDPITLAAAVTNIFKRNQERSVDDHMAEEMQHALNSYGKVAMKRFIDAVPMICVEILQKFPDRMNAALLDVTDNEIERIVVAPQNIISKRDSLKKEIDTLEKGLVALRGDLI